MIIKSIQLKEVRKFNEAVKISGIENGLNVLSEKLGGRGEIGTRVRNALNHSYFLISLKNQRPPLREFF